MLLGGLALAADPSEEIPEPSAEATDAPEPIPLRQPRLGLGLGHGGGGILGLNFNVYLPQQLTLDLGLHWRVAALDNVSYTATALTLGLNREHGYRGARPGYFAKIGTAGGDGGYHETFVAAGFHAGFWTPNQRHTFTTEIGPGLFLVREIPNYNPGPPLLWLWRVSWHLNVGNRG